MAQTTELPLKFIDSLQQTTEPWARELLAHNLKTVFANRFTKSRYLLRSVNGEVRGFLSDRYRRLDSRPIIEAFATAVQQKGALPYDGYVTDTKVALQAIMPEVYEPIPGEMVAYGLSLENSDFGNGALSVRAYLLRIWCSNLAITQEEMRQVHLGKRLDESVLYSQRTYELDAETTVSALRDVIGAQLNADGLRRRMESVRLAHEQSVDAGSARDLLRKAQGGVGSGDRGIQLARYPEPACRKHHLEALERDLLGSRQRRRSGAEARADEVCRRSPAGSSLSRRGGGFGPRLDTPIF